jgi:large subunit ribosomal protein L6
MSRVGRMPITVPPGVAVEIKDSRVTVTGPKGKLSRSLSPDMSFALSGDTLTVSRPSDAKEHRSQHGLTRTLVANMVTGVSQGFEKSLEIVGVGYREGANRIRVSGIDKEAVGEMAAEIRAIRPPDAYKGKGIRYLGETVRLKPGKGKQSGK